MICLVRCSILCAYPTAVAVKMAPQYITEYSPNNLTYSCLQTEMSWYHLNVTFDVTVASQGFLVLKVTGGMVRIRVGKQGLGFFSNLVKSVKKVEVHSLGKIWNVLQANKEDVEEKKLDKKPVSHQENLFLG